MIANIPHVSLYGGINIDIKWRAVDMIYEGSSSIGEKSEHFGGVARNIAEGLARLNIACSLSSHVGDDEYGRRMVSHLHDLQVNTDGILVSSRFPTAQYCAFFHSHHDLLTALTDLRIYDECTEDFIRLALAKNQHARVHVLDTDLPILALTSILRNAHSEIWVVITCIPAVKKLLGVLPHIDRLFLNQSELNSLVGMTLPLNEAVAFVLKRGVKSLVVTLGEQGLFFASQTTAIKVKAIKSPIVDVTGAGDSLVAGCLASYVLGLPLHESLEFAIRSASLTLQSCESVSPKLNELTSLIHDRVFACSGRSPFGP